MQDSRATLTLQALGKWKLIGGRDGCCPRCLLPDKEASLLFFFTTVKTGRRDGSCTHEDRLMRPGRALALPAIWKWNGMVRRHGNAPCRLGGIGVTARVASLTNYRRFDLYSLSRVAMERVCCMTQPTRLTRVAR